MPRVKKQTAYTPKPIAPVDNEGGVKGFRPLEDRYILMLAIMDASSEGVTIKQVHETFKESIFPKMKEAQVYNALKDMETSEFIKKITVTGGAAQGRAGSSSAMRINLYSITDKGRDVLYNFVEWLAPLMKKSREQYDREYAA